jgi:hypothetical protein
VRVIAPTDVQPAALAPCPVEHGLALKRLRERRLRWGEMVEALLREAGTAELEVEGLMKNRQIRLAGPLQARCEVEILAPEEGQVHAVDHQPQA